ncbi:unnamed protein product, partial [Oppiella nova]
MLMSFAINILINPMICIKHIIYSVTKCRLFRRYWIYILMSIIILIIQLILSITFYSSNNSSIESQIQSQFNSVAKPKKIGDKADQSIGDYDSDNNISFSNSLDSKSRDTTLSDHYLKFPQEINEFKSKTSCNISAKSGKYGISAVERAVTTQCKQKLADITCLTLTDQLYPQSLPRFCPLKDGNFGDYVGCYWDRNKPRLLNGYKTKFSDNSPNKCLNVCLQSGYTYAGLEFSNECFCGYELSDRRYELTSNHCNMSCSGAHHLLCGGYYAVDIYKTGLQYRPKVMPSLVTIPVDRNDVRIVFLLTLNGRSLRQINRLLKNIYDSKHFYYIHIDSRQDYLFRELIKLESKLANVRVSRVRLSTIWGGASLLQMLLNSIQQIFETNVWPNSWDFLINISESDFPLKPVHELENFLLANRGKNFVKSHGQDSQRFITKQGLDKTFYECDTHMWRVADRQLPKGIRWDGGSDWVVLSREFCHYITYEDNELLRGLKQVFKYTLLPAESFFHTVLQNSEFCDTIVDNNLRLTNWRRKQGCKCQYKHIVDWCGCSPNDFKTNDWPRLLSTQSKPLFFGRKFEAIVNQNIINRLEEIINKNFSHSAKSVDKYWQNDYDFRDSQPVIDDAKLTFYYAFAVNSQKAIENKCHLKDIFSQTKRSKTFHLSHVQEVDLYFNSDVFEGIIITFQSLVNNEINSILNFQTLVRPTDILDNTINKLSDKLTFVQVCSDFDVKELIFRNFGCILGPFAQPVAMHKWQHLKGEPLGTTFVWVDPINTVAASYEVKVEANATSDQPLLQRPQLNTPLRPGVWRLIVLHKWIVIAEHKFLVTPLLFHNKTKVNKDYAKHLHSGPQRTYTSHNFSAIEMFLGLKNSVDTTNGIKNSRKSGDHLLTWIHDLYSQFWFTQRMCYIPATTSRGLDIDCGLHLLPCHSTDWSPRSPDPKSDISSIF